LGLVRETLIVDRDAVGVTDVLSKPVRYEDLVTAIGRAIGPPEGGPRES
jgi:FixJ family two-component response regulator